MKRTQIIMGMPVTIEVVDATITDNDLDKVFAYFLSIDETFSTYKTTSEISRINSGELSIAQYSSHMQTILALSEETRQETSGYFNIQHKGRYDPSGIVKGWAIYNASNRLQSWGFHHFYIDAGGDIQVCGQKDGQLWKIGIRNPFDRTEYVKVLALTNRGIATSGIAIRGQHIYNPHNQAGTRLDKVASLTVVGPNIYEADRFATAAFAMGEKGIQFIEKLANFEGYMINVHRQATYTSGFERYVAQS